MFSRQFTWEKCEDFFRQNEPLAFRKVLLPRDPFQNRLIAEEVFIDDAMALFRGHAAIPDALRIDQHPRAFAADSETCGLGSQDGNTKCFDALLQKLPCLKPMVFGAAVRSHAEEDMPLRSFDAHFGETGIRWIHPLGAKPGLRQGGRPMETPA